VVGLTVGDAVAVGSCGGSGRAVAAVVAVVMNPFGGEAFGEAWLGGCTRRASPARAQINSDLNVAKFHRRPLRAGAVKAMVRSTFERIGKAV
jgi:hypothetical protein